MKRIVRSGHLVLTLLVAGSALAADGTSLQGVQVGDIDRKADPCTDFFAYANGRWRAENPIPASMPRWSRRWAAGESNKDKLREILEQAAATKAQRGSIEQLTGDFYAGCMNEAQAEQPRCEAGRAAARARSTAIRSAGGSAENHRRAARSRDRRAVPRVSAIRTSTIRRS